MKVGKKRLAAAAIVAAIAVVTYAFSFNHKIARFFSHELVISIAGDIMLDRGVAGQISQNGALYPFENVIGVFTEDDITIANLECPLTAAEVQMTKEIVFKADPKSVDTLKSAGFDALMLANNHAMDYLPVGLADTMTALDSAGLYYAGAGDPGEIKPCFIRRNGIRVGIISYSLFPPDTINELSGPDIAYVREGHLDDMQSEVASAAAQCDFLIVYYHWGIEYRHDVSDIQIEIAHAAVDSGASAVIGTHPHVLQGRETYKGAPVYYSIGNFVFDNQIPDGTDETVILQFTVGKNGLLDVRELPVVINNCQPQFPDAQKAAEIITNLERYSQRFD